MNQFALNPVEAPCQGVKRVTLMMFLIILFTVAISVGQVMQKGISVELPVTSSAVSMPDADTQDALVVAVTATGGMYLGITPITPDTQPQKLKEDLSSRSDRSIYVKADARTAYANVAKVLDAIRMAGVEEPVLLAAQKELSPASTPAPPKGLQVSLASPASAAKPVVLELLNSGTQLPVLKLNGENVDWDGLQQNLTKLIPNGSGKMIVLKADGPLLFASVVRAIDICHSMGRKVVLVTPGM